MMTSNLDGMATIKTIKATAPKSANMPNEDSVHCLNSLIAVSDGAGGCGNFSDRWSKYITEHIPSSPITNFESLIDWYEPIACDFYDWADAEADKIGGPGALKFYEEGSCATLASVWINVDQASWVTYGDSVVFVYDQKSGVLKHSPISLLDFAESPFLLNCNEVSLVESAANFGSFDISDTSIVFAASDALSHYLIATYYAEHHDEYSKDLKNSLDANTYNSNAVSAIISKNENFAFALEKIVRASEEGLFSMLVNQLQNEGVLANDDFSFVAVYKGCSKVETDSKIKLPRKLKKKLRKNR